MTRRYFGTDGIRGTVGQEPITAQFALRLGHALGEALPAGRKLVVIGKDTRISGYLFESALEAGLVSAGADIRLLGPMPTPAIAYLTQTLRAGAGIVISASHNPYQDNGFKFFSSDGEKLPDHMEMAIENGLDHALDMVTPERLGKVERVSDAAGRYIEFCKRTIRYRSSLASLRIVVDCANGATYHVAPNVLRELGATVIPIGVRPDGLNINHQCGSTHPVAVARAVREHQATLGIAFDGDGDRVVMVDERGKLVDGDGLLFVMARARQAANRLHGGVVGTLMTNVGLEIALRELHIPFQRSQIGDRFVHQQLVANQWELGGETSGHILCLDKTTTGDGIVSALEVLDVMVESGQPLSALTADLQRFPQRIINVPVTGHVDLDSSSLVTATLQKVTSILGDEGRVILRPSGTEPVVRVTVEGRDGQQVKQLSEKLAAAVEEAFGQRSGHDVS